MNRTTERIEWRLGADGWVAVESLLVLRRALVRRSTEQGRLRRAE